MASLTYSDLPEVHPTDFPELTPAETSFRNDIADINFPQSYTTTKGDAVGGNELTNNSGLKQADPPTEVHNDRQVASRICGLSGRLFLALVAIGALLVIGAAVGGAVGGTVGRNPSKSKPASDSTSTDTADAPSSSTSLPSSILAKSGIASVNYTDPGGYIHYYVFHQNRNNSIITSLWDSQNQTWQARVVNATGLNGKIMRETPITAVAWSDENSEPNIQVFFLVSGNSINGLETSEVSIESAWNQHELGSQSMIYTGNGSDIVAWRPNGGNSSSPPTLMLWQVNQYITYATSQDWKQTSSSLRGVDGTRLALTSVGDVDNVRWRFYYDDSNALQEGIVLSDFSSSKIGYGFDTPLPSNVKSEIAATCFDQNNMLVINLQEDGSPRARWWGSGWRGAAAPTLQNLPKGMLDPPTFTAISANNGQRIYGIVDGSIHEWRFEVSTPMTWVYVGQVATEVTS